MTCANIHVGLTDHLDPEARAMLMALYSRDPSSITTHLPKTAEAQKSLKQRLSKYYVGYNHKSVGQLASTDVFFEDISLLAAFHLERNKLFNGQECSTRYIDFSKGRFYDQSEFLQVEINHYSEQWLMIYRRALAELTPLVAEIYPVQDFQDHPKFTMTAYQNALRAKVFDRARGLLPVTMLTNVGMTASFDVFNDHFNQLNRSHLKEVVNIGRQADSSFHRVFSYAAKPIPKYVREFTRAQVLEAYPFYESSHRLPGFDLPSDCQAGFDEWLISNGAETIFSSDQVSRHYPITIRSKIDFAGLRDLARHRDANFITPFIGDSYRLEPYYTTYLSNALNADIQTLLYSIHQRVQGVKTKHKHSYEKICHTQYFWPLGMEVPLYFSSHPMHLLYLLKLRTSPTVHETVRRECQLIYHRFQSSSNTLLKRLAGELKNRVCHDPEDLSIQRGHQAKKEYPDAIFKA